MDKIVITGGRRLEGRIAIGGAKNAALPLMVAGLLTEEPITLRNLPNLADIRLLKTILVQHGVTLQSPNPQTLEICARIIDNTTAPYDLVRKMRASFLVIGPLLARCGQAIVSLPGGCAIGARPVDLHLQGLAQLGADIRLEEGYVHASAPGGLKGANIDFRLKSVGATQNVLMAASLAKGTSIIKNAALEPEVTDLVHLLQAMGAEIEGAGTDTLTVHGQRSLGGADHQVIPDRIEAGTYIMAAAMAGGDVEVTGMRPAHLSSLFPLLQEAGIELQIGKTSVLVRRNGGRLRAVDATTEPFPGFPTDLQAQYMTLMTRAEGTSHIRETVFENRFMHAPELMRMGAQIRIEGETAHVTGVDALRGAPVMATDLRASVSLVIAALAAEGQTQINRVYHLDRGFEALEAKLNACGADIARISD